MTTCCLLGSQLEVLGSLQAKLLSCLACLAFKSQDNLTCRLCLFVKDGLGLSTESHLLGVVTALSLCKVGGLSGLVLCDLVDSVLLALAGTVSLAFFRDVHHFYNCLFRKKKKKEMQP